MSYLRSGVVNEEQIYTPDGLGLSSNDDKPKASQDKTKNIIRELRNLKLAQFEIMQKETELLKILENGINEDCNKHYLIMMNIG